jgi:hypothetical protein
MKSRRRRPLGPREALERIQPVARAGWRNDDAEEMRRNFEIMRRHLQDFIDAYNFGRRLKTLKGLAPYEFICKQWTSESDRFTLDPIHQMPGLNTSSSKAPLRLRRFCGIVRFARCVPSIRAPREERGRCDAPLPSSSLVCWS